jgi:nucleoside-diphosphate-sugar epimerase
MQIKGSKVLVTGGAGFIPSHVVDLFVERGAIVSVLDNLKDGAMANLEKSIGQITFFKADLRDAEKVDGIVAGQDIVIHMGANANVPYSVEHPDYDFETNAVGGYNVLHSCVKHKVKKVVYASTAAVYGEPQYTPIDEKHPTLPQSPYGASKLAAERLGFAYHKTYGLPFCAIRIFNTYGERQPRYVMYDLLRKLYKSPEKLEVLGTGEQIRDYSYVSDTALAFVLAAENDTSVGQVYNIAGGRPRSIKEVVQALLETLGLKKTVVTYTGKSWKGDINILIADISKIRNELGFEPRVEFSDGIGRLHQWMKMNEGRR